MNEQIMSDLTARGPQRALGISRLSAAVRFAWILGSALGGFTSSCNDALPAYAAVGMYAVDIVFVLALIPATVGQGGAGTNPALQTPAHLRKPKGFRARLAVVSNAVRNPAVARVLAAALSFGFLQVAFRTTNEFYLQERFEFTPSDLAYMRT